MRNHSIHRGTRPNQEGIYKRLSLLRFDHCRLLSSYMTPIFIEEVFGSTALVRGIPLQY